LKRLGERLEKRLEERLRRLWVRIGETLKRLRWTSVGGWWLAWFSGAATTRYHTLRPTASTRQHGPRSLAAIISERGRCSFLFYQTSIQADHVHCKTGPRRGRLGRRHGRRSSPLPGRRFSSARNRRRAETAAARPPRSYLARGGSVILTETVINDSKITACVNP
jgi:hypothetical protein